MFDAFSFECVGFIAPVQIENGNYHQCACLRAGLFEYLGEMALPNFSQITS